MHYEINVAHKGKHFFATAERSIQDEHKLFKVLDAFNKAFPHYKGYTINVVRWNTIGIAVDLEELRNGLDKY